MNEETLIDRLAGGDYLLDGLVVHVIPPSGVAWTPDDRYGFERTEDTSLTASDLRAHGWDVERSTSGAPPSDVNAAGFSCCAACSTAPLAARCSGCARGTATSKFMERIKRCLA